MVPACSSGTLTNVLPHRNAIQQTQDITPTLSQYTDTGSTLILKSHTVIVYIYCSTFDKVK